MRSIYFAFLFFCLGVQAQSNEIKFRENEIQFSNGNSLTSAISIPNYPANINEIFLEYSNGISGSITSAGREDQSEIYTLDHYLFSDLDSNGIPAPSKFNKYFTFVKPIDDASVDLSNAYSTNSLISFLKFHLWKPTNTGQEIQFFSLELYNVKIFEHWIDFDVKPDGAGYQAVEKFLVSYTFMSIIDQSQSISNTLNWNTR